MQNETVLSSKIAKATTWSAITNILRKLITPLVSMVLARLLSPDAFGVVATINIVISFAEMFSDAGFQKYLVQHDFQDDAALHRAADVAFWTNLTLSLAMWGGILLFRDALAALVGSAGYGWHLSVAACAIPLVSVSSIQQALFRRRLDFKGMFVPRLVNSIIPLIVTVPVAFFTKSCWALIIGSLCASLSDAVLLTVKSKWKPTRRYSFAALQQMFSFSMWSMFEALAIWLTLNIDVFILGQVLSDHDLGLYKTSITTTNQVFQIITTTIVPVLFSSLSRFQSDRTMFRNTLFSFFSKSALILMPVSIGMFLYSDVTTWVLLGEQWMDASRFIGLNSLVQVFVILFANYASEVYRSLGEPKTSFAVQAAYILCIIPAISYGARQGFDTLCNVKILLKVLFVLMNVAVMRFRFHFSVRQMTKRIMPPLFAAILMAAAAVLLRSLMPSLPLRLLTILPCAVVYGLSCLLFAETRGMVLSIGSTVLHKIRPPRKKP